jgi:hypothetical protein
LESRKTGLFLGAGFSYELGMPLVLEATAELKRVLTPERMIEINENRRTKNLAFSDRAIETFNSILVQSEYNYETIVGALEVCITRFENRDIYQDLHGIREWLLELIWNYLADRQTRNFQYSRAGLDFFRGLVNIYQTSKPLWVFSLNHDVTFEMIAKYFDLEVKTGFPDTIEIDRREADGRLAGKIRFDLLSRKNIEAGTFDYHFNYENLGINLLKLHGAIDFFAKDDDVDFVKLSLKNLTFDEYCERVQYLLKSFDQLREVRATNHIGYYDGMMELQLLRKTILSGVHKFDKRVSQVAPIEYLKLFESYINYVDELVVIGYSFSDYHIDSTLRSWLSFTSSRKLTIVDPNIDRVPNYFRHLSPQISLEKMTCPEYFMKLEGRGKPGLFYQIRKKRRKQSMDKLRKRT